MLTGRRRFGSIANVLGKEVMRASVVRNGKMEIDETFPIPSLRTPTDVLVEVHAAGVNGPDLLQKDGRYPAPKDASPLLGLEVAGRVVVGDDSGLWEEGDAVCGLVHGGGYGEYVVVDGRHCFGIDGDFEALYKRGACFPEAAMTAYHNLFHRAKLSSGEILLVHGAAGGVGSMAVAMGKFAGATVIGTVRGGKEREEYVKQCGADWVVDTTGDWEEEVKQIVKKRRLLASSSSSSSSPPPSSFPHFVEDEALRDGVGVSGVDVVLDVVGGEYVGKNLGLLGTEGRLVNIAFQSSPVVKSLNLTRVLLKRLSITASTLRSRSSDAKAHIVQDLVSSTIPQTFLHPSSTLPPHVVQEFPLEAAEDAHQWLQSGKHWGKAVLVLKKE